MTGPQEVVPANSVPAAAVIRGGRALFVMTGRKGHVGGPLLLPHWRKPWAPPGERWRGGWAGVSKRRVEFLE